MPWHLLFSRTCLPIVSIHALLLQEHITRLPQEVLSTPMGQMLAPMLTGVESRLGSVQQGDAPLDLASLTSSLPAPAEASPAVEAAANVEQQRNMAAADRPSTSYGDAWSSASYAGDLQDTVV